VEVSGQFHAPAALPLEESHVSSLYGMMTEPPSRFGYNRKSYLSSESNRYSSVVQPVAESLYQVELSVSKVNTACWK